MEENPIISKDHFFTLINFLLFMKISQSSKIISTSLSPNTEKDDLRLVLKLIASPRLWVKGEKINELEGEFKKYLEVKHAFSFNSGRSSLVAILEALEIKEGDEVLLQGFTCNSAIIPILGRKAKPVFVDIDDTLNLDPQDLEKKITPQSKAVMIQHTFGWPAKIDEILEITRKHNLFLIEDCAHSLGARYKRKFCGTFGDIAFFSFGRDKIISSVFGGMVVTNNNDLAERINRFKKELTYPSASWVFQQLLHPVLVSYLILPGYRFPNFGKLLLVFFQKIKILSKAVHWREKEGKIPSYFPKKLPNALASLALSQFKKLEKFNSHRKKIARLYQNELNKFILPFSAEKEGAIFMRCPVLVDNSDKTLREARKKKILLNDGWRKSPIVPPDTNIERMNYTLGSCPKAEKVADKILNLPTHINISEEKAERIVGFLKNI
jgi:dTDP-4-amino-4,6-dideoxygalactose transaminase